MMTNDRTLRMLVDPNYSIIDIETENHIVASLIETKADKKYPTIFKDSFFSPTGSLMNAIALNAFVNKGLPWGIECVEADIEYKAWVGSPDLAVSAWNPARALTAAIWNKHLSDIESKND